MSDKIPCKECQELILPRTAEKTGGICMACKQGIRESIEQSKASWQNRSDLSKIEKYRLEAFEGLKFCESYKDEDWARIPVNYARRWASAFESTDINLDDLAEIVRDIECERDSYGIGWDLFLMDRRKIYQELFEDFLRKKFG